MRVNLRIRKKRGGGKEKEKGGWGEQAAARMRGERL